MRRSVVEHGTHRERGAARSSSADARGPSRRSEAPPPAYLPLVLIMAASGNGGSPLDATPRTVSGPRECADRSRCAAWPRNSHAKRRRDGRLQDDHAAMRRQHSPTLAKNVARIMGMVHKQLAIDVVDRAIFKWQPLSSTGHEVVWLLREHGADWPALFRAFTDTSRRTPWSPDRCSSPSPTRSFPRRSPGTSRAEPGQVLLVEPLHLWKSEIHSHGAFSSAPPPGLPSANSLLLFESMVARCQRRAEIDDPSRIMRRDRSRSGDGCAVGQGCVTLDGRARSPGHWSSSFNLLRSKGARSDDGERPRASRLMAAPAAVHDRGLRGPRDWRLVRHPGMPLPGHGGCRERRVVAAAGRPRCRLRRARGRPVNRDRSSHGGRLSVEGR